ncbi:uncharacterized protein K441DRAFT_490334, partial [Cenococcum geophilum 1.58]|uniref:uncharacterized protein n=1 Tax=Cenococcum geophilum 1.58 TaxID=794803 RepID=UPI000DC8F9E2
DDFSGAAQHASHHAGDSGDSSLFSNALGMLSGKKQHLQNEDIDEDDAVRQHQQMYGGGGSGQQASSNNMGAAAAMQALKMFTGGQGGGQGGGGGGGQSQFIGMAMAQASKLFDQQSAQGNTHPSATKQDAVSSAAQMALKMYMKSEMGGGGGGGGMGSLMGFASKFM